MLSKVPKLRFVEVVWLDAHANATEPCSLTDLPHSPLTMLTRGFLLRDNDIGISLASEHYTTDDTQYFRGRSFIPRGMVKSLEDWPRRKPRAQPKTTLPTGDPGQSL